MIRKNIKNGGYSLIEMIIYVSLLSVVSIIVVSTVISFTGSYRIIQANRLVDNSGVDAMERIIREIRESSGINVVNSDFVSNIGFLTVITGPVGASDSAKFYVQSGTVRMDINGAYYGPLTSSNTNVTGLKFSLLDNSFSKAIKIDLTVEGTVAQITKTKTFHSTVILKDK